MSRSDEVKETEIANETINGLEREAEECRQYPGCTFESLEEFDKFMLDPNSVLRIGGKR